MHESYRVQWCAYLWEVSNLMEGSSTTWPINPGELPKSLLGPSLRINGKLCKQFKEANNGKAMPILLILNTETYRMRSHDLQQVQEHLVLAVYAVFNIRKTLERVARAQAWSAHTDCFDKLQCLHNRNRDFNSQNLTCDFSRGTILLLLPDVARLDNSENKFIGLNVPLMDDIVLYPLVDFHVLLDFT